MFGLIPKDEKFFVMFKEMTWNIIEGAELLKDLMDNFQDPVGSPRRIKDIEHKGDSITHDIIKKLNKSFVTPLDREDIYALSAALDDSSYLEWYVAQAAASRDAIYDFCEKYRLTFWPSEANFVLIRVGDLAGAIVRALHERHILVRDKSASPGCAGCIRLTAGVTEHTAAALSLLEELLAPRTS